MQIRVLLFAGLANALNTREAILALQDGATVQTAIDELIHQLPDLKTHLPSLAFAVNHAFVKTNQVLADGDELALIPPVSGG